MRTRASTKATCLCVFAMHVTDCGGTAWHEKARGPKADQNPTTAAALRRGMSLATKTRDAHYFDAAYLCLARAAERDLLGAEPDACPPPFAASQASHMRAMSRSTVMRCSTERNQWSMGTNTRRMTR